MSSLMMVCLSGEGRGKTFIFDQDAVTLGANPACDLRLEPSGRAPGRDEAAVAEIQRREKRFELFIHDSDHYSFRINEKSPDGPARPIPLANGDVVAVRATGAGAGSAAEWLVQVVGAETSAPARMALPLDGARLQFPEVDAGGHIHPRTATRFVRELVFALYAEMPGWVRAVAILLTALVPLSVLTATGVVFAFLLQYQKITEDLRTKNQGAEGQIAEQLKRIEKLQSDLSAAQEAVNSGSRIAKKYSASVCLIVGKYTYFDRAGRPLRYIDHSFDNGFSIAPDGKVNVSFEGAGEIFYDDFDGTGFVVDAGLIITNRHIAEPWYGDSDAQDRIFRQMGGAPKIKTLQAYFLNYKKPFDLKPVEFSADSDVAVCSFVSGDASIAKLELQDSEEIGDIRGETVVLLGYPTGVDGIIERLPNGPMKDSLKGRIAFSDEKAADLAKIDKIEPLVTQGHVTGLNAGRIVHDAATTLGGSGSPIFNSAGKVIGINAEVMTDGVGQVPGGNLGVPIRAALPLIRRVNGKSPAAAEEAEN